MHSGQLWFFSCRKTFSAANLLLQLPSQPPKPTTSSSAAASFPLATARWHFSWHAAFLFKIVASSAAHFPTAGLGGMKPVSSPPHGVPAVADATHRPTDSAPRTNTVRNMRTSLLSTHAALAVTRAIAREV